MAATAAGLSTFGLLARLAFFILLELLGLQIFAFVLHGTAGYLIAAAVGTFLAAVVANAVVVRIWERGRLEDIGMGWAPASLRNLLRGTVAGISAALFVVGLPMVTGLATLQHAAEPAASPGRFVLVTVVLLFGAAGEELLFRGYGFQLLLARLGPWATVLPFGVLFAAAHVSNLNASWLGLINTGAWGVLFGYAFLRSHDLWLPIGLHFGWNWTLPLFGATLSGFTMGLTGYELRWLGGDLWSGGAYGPEASILTTVVVAVLAFWLTKAPIERQVAPILAEAGE